jgi:hypothetical protein
MIVRKLDKYLHFDMESFDMGYYMSDRMIRSIQLGINSCNYFRLVGQFHRFGRMYYSMHYSFDRMNQNILLDKNMSKHYHLVLGYHHFDIGLSDMGYMFDRMTQSNLLGINMCIDFLQVEV